MSGQPTDYDIVFSLLSDVHHGHNVFDIPLINNRINDSRARTTTGVKEELLNVASDVRANNIPQLAPDEIATQYSSIFDQALTIWDEQPSASDIERKFGPISHKRIVNDAHLWETFGSSLKQWVHSAPVTHTRSQRNFLQDYSHLRSPLRKYLLSHAVHGMNESIIDFAQRGGLSCFQRCIKDKGKRINEDEKRCVHFCGETLADVRKILVTDWLNYSENLEQLEVPTLPAGNEMGDKETGVFNSANRSSLWNQYARQDTANLKWINQD